MKGLFFLSLLFACTLSSVLAQNINVSASKISFSVMNRGTVVNGTMLNMKGTVLFDAKDLNASSFEASIDPSTVNTNSAGRDKHLQKDDFFGANNFPKITIKSSKISKTANGFLAQASLQLRDITTPIEIPFTVKKNADNQQVLEGELQVDRIDYKLGEKIDKKSIGFEVDVQITCVVDL